MMRTWIRKGWEGLDVARLSPESSKVLLVLLLSGSETRYTQAEFAILSGLSGQLIPEALFELEQPSLIQIIAQQNNTPLVTLQAHPFLRTDGQNAYTHETAVREAIPAPYSPSPDGTLLQLPGKASSPQVRPADAEPVRTVSALDQCRLADESGKRQEQVKALRALWDVVFPEDTYPYQRLTEEGARSFLRSGRTAEEVGSAITGAVERAISPIKAPRGFIEAVLKNKDRKQAGRGDAEEEPELINDGLRKLAELGNKQFRKA